MIYRGQAEIAVLGLDHLTDVAGESADAWLASARAHRAVGDETQARAAARRGVELAGEDAGLLLDLAEELRLLGARGEAAAVLGRLCAGRPDDAVAHASLAMLEAERPGQDATARTAMERAVELDAAVVRWPRDVARWRQSTGDPAGARAALVSGLVLRPGDEELRYLLHALEVPEEFERAPDAYLKEFFDHYAETFERRLRDDLDYRAPELVVGAALAALGGDRTDLAVLDLGCGTGVCGPLLRAAAATLVGVDISAGMLEQAAGHAVYDELIAAEITQLLADDARSYDLITAADVLIYFGDLHDVLAAAAARLCPGGMMAFSVESKPEAGLELSPSGRWRHSAEHIADACCAAGLVVDVNPKVLRQEANQPVVGLVAVARRA